MPFRLLTTSDFVPARPEWPAKPDVSKGEANKTNYIFLKKVFQAHQNRVRYCATNQA